MDLLSIGLDLQGIGLTIWVLDQKHKKHATVVAGGWTNSIVTRQPVQPLFFKYIRTGQTSPGSTFHTSHKGDASWWISLLYLLQLCYLRQPTRDQ